MMLILVSKALVLITIWLVDGNDIFCVWRC